MMLGLGVLLTGCESANRSNHGPAFLAPPTPPPVDGRAEADAVTDDDASEAQTDAGDPAPTDPAPAAPAEPIAVRLVDAMMASLDRPSDRPIRIAVTGVRNQSRSTAEEFETLLDRLAAILDETADTDEVTFSRGRDDADYRMTGTAYLVTEGGFDQWSLFIDLRPSGERWSAWHADDVRLLRFARPGQPQLVSVE